MKYMKLSNMFELIEKSVLKMTKISSYLFKSTSRFLNSTLNCLLFFSKVN